MRFPRTVPECASRQFLRAAGLDSPQGLLERFLSRVSEADTDVCWPWKGTKIKGGYGILVYGGVRWARAHRFAYSVSQGAVPGGLKVLHRCDNPSCVNPRHLFLGTNLDNVRDRVRKGRSARGESHGSHKLTRRQVLRLRRECRPGLGGALARKYGITRSVVSKIVRGVLWKHV